MEITQEQLEKVAEYGSLLLSIKEIAILLGFNIMEFEHEYSYVNSQLFKIYNKAVLETKIKLRTPTIQMASLGSPHAQQIAQQYLIDQRIKDDQ